MAAPNKIELVVEANTSQANQNLNSVNETLKGTERQTVQSSLNMTGAMDKLTSSIERLVAIRERSAASAGAHSSAMSHEVSAVQATSGALRALEGNFTQNIRAAERFIATTLGMGEVLQKVFPLIGGVAFGGLLVTLVEHAQKLYEWFQKIADVPNKIKQGFFDLNETIRVSNDQMAVTNDRLSNEIAKLSGKPQNGLKLALDEARLAADNLVLSLAKGNQEALKLLMEKDNSIGFFGGLVTANAPTTGVAQGQKQFSDQVTRLMNGYNEQLANLKPGPESTTLARDIQNRMRSDLQKAYRAELDTVNKQLQSSQNRTAQAQQGPGQVVGVMNGVPIYANGRPVAQDQSAVQAALEGRRANLTQQLARMALIGDNQDLTQRKEVLEANKDSTNAMRDFAKAAQKLLIDSQVGYKNGDSALSHISEMMERGREQGLMSPQASVALFQALQNVVGGPNRTANQYGGLIGRDNQKIVDSFANPDRADVQDAKKAFDANIKYQDEVLQAAMEAIDKQYDYQLEKLDESKTLQMKQVETVNAQTVQQKLWVEQRKYDIEKDYVDKSTDLQISKLNADAERQRQVAMTAAQHAISQIPIDQSPDREPEVYAGLSDQLGDINDATNRQISAIRGKGNTQLQEAASAAARAQTQVVQTEYKKVYDSILSETDHFLDAVTGKTKNAWKSLADELKNLFLKPLKEMIEAPIAQYLTQMITGIQGNGQMGKAGGQIFNRGGAAGSAPLAGLGALFGAGGFGGGGGVSYAGAPGGTPGFAGPVMSGGAPMMMGNNFSGGGGGGLLARLFGGNRGGGFGGYSPSAPAGLSAGDLANLGDFNGNELGKMASGGTPWSEAPNLGMDHVAMGMPGGSTTGGGGLGGLLSGLFGGGQGGKMANAAGALAGATMWLSSMGKKGAGGVINSVGGAGMAGFSLARMAGASGPYGALAGAGTGLLTNSFSHPGTVGGFFEGLGGGALAGGSIGMMLGGPIGGLIGAGIGAGVGLVSGIVNLLRKSPRQKVIDDVMQAYRVKIPNSVADQIVKIADEQYGSNYAFAVSTPQVRELVSLYGASTGAFNANIAPKMTPYTISASGSSLANLAGTTYGYSTAGLYGGVIPSSNNGAPMPQISLQLNGDATTALLNGQIAATAPAAVSAGYQSSINRQSTYAGFAQPGLVVR